VTGKSISNCRSLDIPPLLPKAEISDIRLILDCGIPMSFAKLGIPEPMSPVKLEPREFMRIRFLAERACASSMVAVPMELILGVQLGMEDGPFERLKRCIMVISLFISLLMVLAGGGGMSDKRFPLCCEE